jgi:hypothetical protein
MKIRTGNQIQILEDLKITKGGGTGKTIAARYCWQEQTKD